MKLGDIVKDKHSPWQGVVSTKLIMFNGSVRFVVCGNDDGKPGNFEFDETQLEVIEEAAEDPTPKPTGKIKVGMKVRDITSNWEGVVIAEILYLNGCVRYEVQGPKEEKRFFSTKSYPVVFGIDEALLEPIPTAPIHKPEQKRLGGSRSMRPMSR